MKACIAPAQTHSTYNETELSVNQSVEKQYHGRRYFLDIIRLYKLFSDEIFSSLLLYCRPRFDIFSLYLHPFVSCAACLSAT